MSFKITARTILHLGSDLISSDAVAIYELIKNAIDAKSKNGVDVEFLIVIRESDFASAMALLDGVDASGVDLDDVKSALLSKINQQAPEGLRTAFVEAVIAPRTKSELRAAAREAYAQCNKIVVSDTGDGMSHDDLKDIYLTIGTTNRAKAVREAQSNGQAAPPYLGEKGVGRLSVMRLGWRVRIETVTQSETRTNVLEIDWKKFEEADDAMAASVVITPRHGAAKSGAESYTRITISDLRSSWNVSLLTTVAQEQIARLTDPFSWAGKRRFQVRLSLNGAPVQPVKVIATELLQYAHGKCKGELIFERGRPILVATLESSLYGGDPKTIRFDVTDLMSMSGLRGSGYPATVLDSLGPFAFEMYWFNRQRIRGIPDVGEREAVRNLVKVWAGVCLFRDGYRVLPYGDAGDDWLNLDLEALAASGYKLNTKQIIGRVSIGRLTNPKLLDQTNRQGLIECPEKKVLIMLMHDLVSRWWHDYLNESLYAQKRVDSLTFDAIHESKEVNTLEARATGSLQEIRGSHPGEARLLREVKDAFLEIKEAHQRAVARISTIEEEKDRLTQLAGVGLLVEVIAHELTRATELTQSTLKDLSRRNIDVDATAALKTLGEQIKVIQKRLVALEPLSVTARFRRSKQRLSHIVEYVFEGHRSQFMRHKIAYKPSPNSDLNAIGFVIEGHVVQILENLITNSVYWLDLERKAHPSFEPEIHLQILAKPTRIRYFDNGPGIPRSRAESVFEPFFSTKAISDTTRRQGLGLYIARQNAESLGGALNLIDADRLHQGRFNTFELELQEEANESQGPANSK